MRPVAFALLLALVAAPFARRVECVPDCCRASDGSTMAACPMSGASPGHCQLRECSPESAATAAVSVHPAVLTHAVAQLELAPPGASLASPAPRLLFAQRDPLIPPPRT